MVLKKLGDGLTEEFHKVVEYLGIEQSMQVVVEPHEHKKMVWPSFVAGLNYCLCCDQPHLPTRLLLQMSVCVVLNSEP